MRVADLGIIPPGRLSGVPILSDNTTGYFLPGNDGETGRGEIERAAEAAERGA